jgi:hypothetical protein
VITCCVCNERAEIEGEDGEYRRAVCDCELDKICSLCTNVAVQATLSDITTVTGYRCKVHGIGLSNDVMIVSKPTMDTGGAVKPDMSDPEYAGYAVLCLACEKTYPYNKRVWTLTDQKTYISKCPHCQAEGPFREIQHEDSTRKTHRRRRAQPGKTG